MYASMGTTNAHVLPEPVSAMPMTSRFSRPMGDGRHLDGRGFVVPHLLNRANDLRGHRGLAPAPHRRRKTTAARRDVVILTEDAPVTLGHLLRRLLGPVTLLGVCRLARLALGRHTRAAPQTRRFLVRDAPDAQVAAGLGNQRHLPLGALLGHHAAVHAGARTAAKRQRALVRPFVQRVQVHGGVLVLIPIELELELVARLRDFLSRLRAAHVLRANQLQFALARARGVRVVAIRFPVVVVPSVVRASPRRLRARVAERKRASGRRARARAFVAARRNLLLSSFQRGGFSVLLAHERRARGRLRLGFAFPQQLFQVQWLLVRGRGRGSVKREEGQRRRRGSGPDAS